VGSPVGRAPRTRRLATGLSWAVLALAALCAPLYLGPTALNLLGQFLAMAILAVGLDLIWGYTGILSLGQAVFFGIGGYLMAFYLKTQGLAGGSVPDFMMYSGVSQLPLLWEWSRHFGLALLFVLVVPGLIGWLFGLIVFRSRIKSVYFSILTQALAVGLLDPGVGAPELHRRQLGADQLRFDPGPFLLR